MVIVKSQTLKKIKKIILQTMLSVQTEEKVSLADHRTTTTE